MTKKQQIANLEGKIEVYLEWSEHFFLSQCSSAVREAILREVERLRKKIIKLSS